VKNKPQKQSGNIQGTFSLAVHLVFAALHHLAHLDQDIQGTFREYSGNIQGTFRERSGNIQGTFRVYRTDGNQNESKGKRKY
jgi:hypothetical protein